MSRMSVVLVLVCAAVSLGADECGGCAGGEDVVGPAPCNLPALMYSDGGIHGCVSDQDCSDGIFCNGVERCVGDRGNACGCVRDETLSGCNTDQVCDEERNTCGPMGCETPDVDGDGHRVVRCGGDDCDDNDANRFPGRMEVCDAADHDEDCDPATFGHRDADGDAHDDDACCNVDTASVRRCGNDCDDTQASSHPGSPEVCNGTDDDCDTAIDEGVYSKFYEDADADGFGTAISTQACTTPVGYSPLSGDCDDTQAGIVPGAFRCNPLKPNEVAICLMGAFSAAFCAAGETCHQQPNGSGICY